MTNNQEKTLVLIQQVYFDICDLINGDSYQNLGYSSRKEWLYDQQHRLLEVQARLKQDGINNEQN